MCLYMLFFFFKQKTAYEMRISDWSSDVCSSDLILELSRLDAEPGTTTAVDLPAMFEQLEDNARIVAPAQRIDSRVEPGLAFTGRSEERRVGKEGVRSCRFRWSPYH